MNNIKYKKINKKNIAYKNNFSSINTPEITLVFLSGYLSDMQGTKSQFLEKWSTQNNIGYLCFDYSGHGSSSGNAINGTISDWKEEAIKIISDEAQGKIVLIGSSMGGWLALLAAQKLKDDIAGILTIAAAADFTQNLMWNLFDNTQKEYLKNGNILEFSRGPCVYKIKQNFIEDGKKNLILNNEIKIKCPVYLLHGLKDEVVPLSSSIRIAEQLTSEDVQITISKSADHRMSDERDLAMLKDTLKNLMQKAL